jgi:hypothetical protein
MVGEQLFYCVVHTVICGALFLLSGSMATSKPLPQQHTSRIGYMTVLMIVYLVILAGVGLPGLARPITGWPPGVRETLNITLSFVACSSLAWWLLTVFVSIVSNIIGPQPKIRFHLLTMLVATLLIGLLMAANFHRIEDPSSSLVRYGHGWPLSFYWNEKGTGTHLSIQLHWILFDLVLWTLMVSIPFLICEWWCRRRDELSCLQERNRQRERAKARARQSSNRSSA